MNNSLAYYSTGENVFRSGEAIYINRATEQAESHLHAHNFIEIAYVASGEGIHKIEGMEYTVSKGDLFVINYDVAHEFRSFSDPSQPRLIVYNCIFKPEFLDYTLINCKDFSDIAHHFLFRSLFPHEDNRSCDIKLLGKDSVEIESLYTKMYTEYIDASKGYIEMLRAYVILLLVTIFRLYAETDRSDDQMNIRHKQMIEKVMVYMKENYRREVKLEELSMMSFFSRNYFCKLFKETTGMTVSEYIQKLRIEEACSLLQNTNKTILEISLEVGYRDLKFFTEVFKRLTGKTPGSYRKTICGI